jgi:glycosyltransferase involved in cell wall biosynthesis
MSQSHNIPLTVLMPAYNTGLYIREAIQSILDQTFIDFEFIIINDGSKDNTLDVIRTFSDPRIKIIDQQNKGLIDTLNEGIEIAKGDIIARMDADDICYPERLEIEYNFLIENPDYVLVGSEADVIDKDGNYLMHLSPVGHTHEEIEERIDIKCPFIHPSVMFRKSAVIAAGLYPKNALTFEDHLLWKKLLKYGRICNLPETLLKARFNPESVTIDEKWRGSEFVELRRKALSNGIVADDDAKRLKEIIQNQNFATYKQASYHAMVGKKYLWNNPSGKLARKHFAEAIRHYPKNPESYILYMFSFLPAAWRVGLYKSFKK